jgi:phosphoribosyl 1,2-cyclic phosphodiesterase
MTLKSVFKVRFWGTCGSCASPMTESGLISTIDSMAKDYESYCLSSSAEDPLDPREVTLSGFLDYMKSERNKIIAGGNTSCVEVLSALRQIGDEGYRTVLDMGTGARALGNSLMKEMLDNGGLEIVILLSHMHWDHIQGMPFFAPLYMNKLSGVRNSWHFFGGNDWQRPVEACLAGQMDPPNFPVSWPEIQAMTYKITANNVMDMFSKDVGGIKISAHKLDHPQETYGWRLEEKGKSVVYATDQEPRDPRYPHPSLIALSKNADLLIIDCQYSDKMYHAPPVKYGWGHSYPTAVAHVAAQAKVKSVALFHHNPGATRLDIQARVNETREALALLKYECNVFAATEGMEVLV